MKSKFAENEVKSRIRGGARGSAPCNCGAAAGQQSQVHLEDMHGRD
jgi:hypothetical protein